ncbi:GNAT family N-acetyltransferase [Pokkaliibacter sp. CJK22405]|uniref:GNAT family N-acetyltransferase n=1 Tax=Pokkaliibacter sp. CJK22405 TaxID=3384615 RepID=UPI00398521AD
MSAFELRLATDSDATAVAVFLDTAFRHTYSATNRAVDIELYCSKFYGPQYQAREIADKHMSTLLLLENEEIMGVAQLRWGIPSHDFSDAESAGEVQRFYIADALHGKGAAQALMKSCFQSVLSRGLGWIWLAVWEANPRAIAFYRKLGFTEVAEQRFQLGEDVQRDLVMARRISVSAQGGRFTFQ